jgi:hypothetical protein
MMAIQAIYLERDSDWRGLYLSRVPFSRRRAMADTKGKIKDKIDSAAKKAKEVTEKAGEAVKGAAKKVGEKVKDVGQNIKERGS